MAVKAPPRTEVAAVYNWTGFYVGGHVGYGQLENGWTDRGITAAGNVFFINNLPNQLYRNNADAFLGGGQVGYNWQSDRLLIGVEGEYSWMKSKGQVESLFLPGAIPFAFALCAPVACTARFTSETDGLASVTGRLGYAASNWLFFVKGGAAWINTSHEYVVPQRTATTGFPTVSLTRTGWTVGTGVEYGFLGNWSAKLEYQYYDFGSGTYTFPFLNGARFDADIEQRVHAVKLGINYRFGNSTVVAKY